jgi:sialate O-acetylesterase
MLLLAVALGLGGCAEVAAATLTMHTFIADHMVLAREPLSARIWGNATVGATVTVALAGGGSAKSAPAAMNGSWSVELPPQPAGAGHSLTVSDGTTTLKLSDVAFGDVYLCTGQVRPKCRPLIANTSACRI